MGLDLIPLNFPFGCGPGSDPPQFPPWVWAWRGGLLLGGLLLEAVCSGEVSAPGDVCSGVGGVVCSWGVSTPGGGCVSALGGVSAPGGSALGMVSQHALRQTPPC